MPATLAQRVALLFQNAEHRLTLRSVAETLRTHYHVKISAATLGEVATGTQPNPSIGLLEGLAIFFSIDPAYFFVTSQYANRAFTPPAPIELISSYQLDPIQQSSMVDTPPSLATKLNLLMDVARDANNQYKPYSSATVCRYVLANAPDTALSQSYFGNLLDGSQRNPSKRAVEALAQVFTIDVAYFLSSVFALPIFLELRILQQIQHLNIQAISHRSLSQSGESIDQLLYTIQLLKKIQIEGGKKQQDQP
jgi:transcriptional regulator with XRE-family HTH domain